MPLNVNIVDARGGGGRACVTPNGELVVAPIAYDSVKSLSLSTINIAFNLVAPSPNREIVITGLSMYANKGVGNNDAVVEIYTATSATDTVVGTAVFTTEIPKFASQTFLPLNVLVDEGVWINAKTDDNTIFVTVTYHYIGITGQMVSVVN